jgi:hypothetical protein
VGSALNAPVQASRRVATAMGDYNGIMARGWESKSVEAQQAEASESKGPIKPVLSPAEKVNFQKKEGLLLDRTRVLQQLEGATNQHYRVMLQDALTELDRKIAALG